MFMLKWGIQWQPIYCNNIAQETITSNQQ